MLGLIGAGVGLASGAFGAIKANNARKQQERYLNDQEKKNQEWYNRNYYQNYLDTAEAQAAMKRVEDTMKRNNEQTEATAAIMGATPEAVLAQKQANQEQLGNMATGLAAQATQRKAQVDAVNLQSQQNILNARMGQAQANEAGASQVMNGGLGMIGTALQGSGMLDKWLTPKTKKGGGA